MIESDLEMTGSLGDTSADNSSLNLSSSFGTSPRKMSLVERMSSLEASGDLGFREGTSVAITVIQVKLKRYNDTEWMGLEGKGENIWEERDNLEIGYWSNEGSCINSCSKQIVPGQNEQIQPIF